MAVMVCTGNYMLDNVLVFFCQGFSIPVWVKTDRWKRFWRIRELSCTCDIPGSPCGKNQTFQQGIAGKTVSAMDTIAGGFAYGI